VEIRSLKGNKFLGIGRLTMASSQATVTVKLKRPLPGGRYRATARGVDAFRHPTRNASRKFSLTTR